MAGVPSATDTEPVDIHSAVKRNDEVQIKKYVCRGGDLEARDKDALTPLHVASAGGSAAVVEYLIKKGARCVHCASQWLMHGNGERFVESWTSIETRKFPLRIWLQAWLPLFAV